MSVLFETSLGDIIVDLETTLQPVLSLNFLKLCKSYYYNHSLFHNVIPQFIAQTGDPTESGSGGSSIWHTLPSNSPSYQKDPYFLPPSSELLPSKFKHTSLGTLSMALAQKEGGGTGGAGSQFFFTLEKELDYLDGKHAPFGRVVEGEETLIKIGDSLLDGQGRPLRDIRIRHVIVLDDPFPDPPGLIIPPSSPAPTPAQLASLRIGEDEALDSDSEDPELSAQKRRAHEASAQALTLEMVGDLPFADVAPPENVLFVCKLNQVTTSEDLELIFSRFGEIWSCEIIRDEKTGDSLQYAFVEFKERESAEKAYVKMDNVLVDDRRIHVDFSQSVSKLHNTHVFNKTGGRPPPNKSNRSQFSSNRDDGGDDRRGGRGGNDLVFDMNEVHSSRSRNNQGGRAGDRDRERRRDDGRSGGRDRDDYRRRDERGGGGGSGGRRYDDREREKERERERSPRGARRDRDRARDREGESERNRDRRR